MWCMNCLEMVRVLNTKTRSISLTTKHFCMLNKIMERLSTRSRRWTRGMRWRARRVIRMVAATVAACTPSSSSHWCGSILRWILRRLRCLTWWRRRVQLVRSRVQARVLQTTSRQYLRRPRPCTSWSTASCISIPWMDREAKLSWTLLRFFKMNC